MPEEIEVETSELQETIDELREEREEREREARATAWTRWISLTTALLAVFAAIGALQSGSLVNEALVKKNEAVLKQAQASDQWAYYQAKGLKKNGAEQTADLMAVNPERATYWSGEAKRYKKEQKDAETAAKTLEKERDEKGEEAEGLMHHHHIFAFCVTFLQVAIALSAIAALTRSKPVWLVSLLVGVGGIIYFANGFLQPVHMGGHQTPHATEHQLAAGNEGEKTGEHSKEKVNEKTPGSEELQRENNLQGKTDVH